MRQIGRMKGYLLLIAGLCVVIMTGCGTMHATVRSSASILGSPSAQARAPMTTTKPTATANTSQCTPADLNAPPITKMPTPETVASPITFDQGNETLSPPDTQPKLTAAQAWAAVAGSGFGPKKSGTAHLLLADLSAETPATIQNYAWPPGSDHPDTQATPLYAHTLVWAIVATDQAEVATGPAVGPLGTETTVQRPPCFLETAVSYVDAATGSLLVSENF